MASERTLPAQTPSADQLNEARAAHWHQNETPLLSLGDLREWLNRSGLVLYAQLAQQLGAPAPTLVEAVQGKSSTADLAEQDAAKALLTRLIAEGAAVPLNLLGASGANGTDVPDFICSAAVFSFIFTLRGNKAWKQAPETSGAVKVTPLALAVYNLLAEHPSMSAYDITTQLGKGVSETAVLRALTELWGQLRVLPTPQPDGAATLWELAQARFTKQIKSGANAGQPTALSALVSLYLGQAMIASEDEIESFLSPLAARSRLRDVVHALLAARQLETVVIDGKTLLHVTGELPVFAAAAQPEAAPLAEAGESVDGGPRISKFTGKPGGKIGTGLRAKPAFSKKPFGKPAFGSGDRERRPFRRDDSSGPRASRPDRPIQQRPWDEDKASRIAASGQQDAGAQEGSAPDGEARPFSPQPFAPRPAPRRDFGNRPQRSTSYGDKPRFAPRREGFSESPAAGNDRPRRDGDSGPRKTFSKPGTFGRKREGAAGGSGFGEGRPPRREFSPRPDSRGEGASRPAGGGFKRPGSYSPRPSGDFGNRSERPAGGGFKRSFSPRTSDRPAGDFAARADRQERPTGSGFKRPGSYSPRPAGEFAPREQGDAPRKVYRKFDAPRDKKPFAPRSGDAPRGDRPAFGSERPRTFDRPRPGGSGSSDRSERPRSGEGRPSFGAKPFGSKPSGFAKKAASKSAFAGKGGPFAKFADGKKPFRKPGKPSGPKPGGGGFAPTRRKRPEGGQ